MFKKIISCILIIIAVLSCFSACGKKNGDAPDGMYSVTAAGEPFILYVPEGWTDNRDSGISSAYYSLADAVTVSARYYSPEIAEGVQFSLDAYVDSYIATFAQQNPSFAVDENAKASTTLGEKEAIKYEYTFKREIAGNGVTENTDVLVIQCFTEHNGDVIILSFYCKESAYNSEYEEMFNQIRKNFAYTDKVMPDATPITDKKTPEGMKIASFDNCEYIFYVPNTWVCDMSDKLSEAYFDESGRPNVTVTSFSPDEVMKVDEYFAECEQIYKQEDGGIEGYELLSAGVERTVAEIGAKTYTFKAVYSGTEYKIMQTMLVYNDMIYTLTYTAIADRFDAHLADVEIMLNSFRFR